MSQEHLESAKWEALEGWASFIGDLVVELGSQKEPDLELLSWVVFGERVECEGIGSAPKLEFFDRSKLER